MTEQINEIKETKLTGDSEQKVEPEKKEKSTKVVPCEVCNEKDDIRIILRQCGHVICLPCILEYVKNRIIIHGHPRFKCQLSTCNVVIHENDINAILDEKEPALENYMPIVHRRYLQHKQNKHSLLAALPSSDIKRCPLCRSVYMREPGCNYVICANSVCNTAFCWLCEKPIGRPCSHFTVASNCRLGYTDYERLFRSVQLALDVNFVILWILLPFVYLIAFLYIPIFILFLVPASLAYDAYRKERDSHDFLVPIDIVTIMFRIIIGIVIGVVVSIPFAIGSIASGFVLTVFYMGFLVIRTVPCGLSGDRVGSMLCLMRWAGRIFKIGPYGKLLEEARRERRDAMMKLEENQDDFQNAISESSGVSTGATSTLSPTEALSTNVQSAAETTETHQKTTTSTTSQDHAAPSNQLRSLAKPSDKMLTEQRFPNLSIAEAERTSSRGWVSEFDAPENFKDITHEAKITLSSVVHGGGVDELLHSSAELAWRTNMSPPHQAVVTFARKTYVSHVMLYLDYPRDESYCPQEVRIDLGWATDEWAHRVFRKVHRPKGWVKIRLFEDAFYARRIMALQMTVLKNHEKGRDCVIRHFRVLGPAINRYDRINRMILGFSGVLETTPEADKTRDLIMNNYMSIR